MLQKLRKHIAISLLILFTGYTAGVSLFYHSHVIKGVTYVHSHPFNKSGHTHTAVELDLIQHLNHLTSIIPDLVFVSLAYAAIIVFALVLGYISKNYTSPYYGKTTRRGPPTLMLF